MATPSDKQLNEFAMQVAEIWEKVQDLKPSDLTPESKRALEALKESTQRIQIALAYLRI